MIRKFQMIAGLVTAGLFIYSPQVCAQLSDAELTMVKYVDQYNPEALTLLEKVVNINSGSMNFAGVHEVGQVFMAELDDLGFATRWIDGETFQRSGHLVAERNGSGPRILLIGHLDTVFPVDSPFQHYTVIDDSTVHGPGVGDMKGGDVIIIQALKALKAAGQLEKMSITVVMTGDEERSGRPLDLARQALVEAADAADIALGFENGDGDPRTAIVARRSSSGWTLRVTGRPAHSSQIFKEKVGAGAIYEASRILNSFYERLSAERYLTFNPGVMLAGTDVEYDATLNRGKAFGKSNVVAGQALVNGDIRTISPEQLQRAKAAMQAIITEHRPQTSAELVFRDSYPPLAPTEGNKRLLGILDQVSRDLGFGPVAALDPSAAGAADVSFTAGRVEMVIDGLGLGGAHDHTDDEVGDIRTLPVQAKRAAVLMHRLVTAQ